MAKKKSKHASHQLANRIGIIIVILLFGALLYGFFTGKVQAPRRRGGATPAQSSSTGNPGGTSPRPPGKPWEYDATKDQYYNPLPGHQHWHQGRPPLPGEQGRPVE